MVVVSQSFAGLDCHKDGAGAQHNGSFSPLWFWHLVQVYGRHLLGSAVVWHLLFIVDLLLDRKSELIIMNGVNQHEEREASC